MTSVAPATASSAEQRSRQEEETAGASARSSDQRTCSSLCQCITIVILTVLLVIALIVIAAGVLWYFQAPPESMPMRFYDPNYNKYLAYFPPGKRSKNGEEQRMSEMQYLFQTGACGLQHVRNESDEYYFTTLMGIPMLPSSSGFMSTHSSVRFLSVFEQVALLIGERKHGLWRFQENGFTRVYREKGSEEGITEEEKQAAIDMGGCTGEPRTPEERRMLNILKKHYKNLERGQFEYAFGRQVVEPETKWLNWIDLPLYHPWFDKKYEDHEPVDLSIYYCQQSSEGFPHIGATWDTIINQPAANVVGPLGKRAGLDVKENFNNIVRLNLFPDASLWANIGRGDPKTDEMMRNLTEMKERVQTVNHEKVDLEKVEMEVYLFERIYHNQTVPYLFVGVVMSEKSNEEVHSYIRPNGNYYDCLVEKEKTIINTVPNVNPTIAIVNETEAKKVHGLPAWGMAYTFPDFGEEGQTKINGGGCPTKGGDTGIYPWGSTGAGWPIGVNYEETTTLCDGFLIDLKLWYNLDGEDSWTDPSMYLGNAGLPYTGQVELEYRAQGNLYGKFRDPYNDGKTNPHELDFTEDHKVRYKNESDDYTIAKFTLDFGKTGVVTQFNETTPDMTPRGCLADEARASDYCGPSRGTLLP